MASEGWTKPNLTTEDISSMQIDAMRRVQEMRELAQKSINSTPPSAGQTTAYEPSAPAPAPIKTQPPSPPPPAKVPPQTQSAAPSGQKYEMPSSRSTSYTEKTNELYQQAQRSTNNTARGPQLKPLPPQTADLSGDKLANMLALMAMTDKGQTRDKALITALMYLLF